MVVDGKTSAKIYMAGGVAFVLCLVSTLHAQPLVPLKLDSVDWNKAWLFATLGDYYCQSLFFAGVVLSTEGMLPGIFWCLGLWLAGSWVACLYAALRLQKLGGSALELRGEKDGLLADYDN